MILTTGIFIADTPDSFVSTRIPEAELKFGGIPGDRHFGITFPSDGRQSMYPRGTKILNKRQISILSKEELEVIASEMGIDFINPEWIGANLLLSGFPTLTSLPIHTRLIFPSGAGLICEGENRPCIHAGEEIQKHFPDKNKLGAGFVKSALGKRGIVCSVEREGAIKQGDPVNLIFPK